MGEGARGAEDNRRGKGRRASGGERKRPGNTGFAISTVYRNRVSNENGVGTDDRGRSEL